MLLRSLTVCRFRCYHEAHFEFQPGVNLICGPNARGKTSLLEAIYLLITGRSFRASQLSDLINLGSQNFYVETTFIKHGIEQRLAFGYDGRERKITYNSTSSSQTSNLLGILQGVTLTPDDANLVKGSPAGRRHFLDLQIAQMDPLYVHHLTRYQRAMRQRNCLLRAKSTTAIESWEQELAKAGAYVIKQRERTIADLQGHIKQSQHAISAQLEEIKMTYKTSTPLLNGIDGISEHLMTQYRKLRSREMAIGTTLVGPHKDDVLISLSDKEIRTFASEGQQRSFVIALRMAEWQRLHQSGCEKEQPLMLLDDVGMSLDAVRRERLLSNLPQFGQVFVTSTDAGFINDAHVHVIPLE